MTFIGQNLPELVPFMKEPYTPQAVNQARNSFKKKVRKSGATFFYGALCGFFTTEELDDLLFESSEVARFLLEVERTELEIDEELEIEDHISEVMRQVAKAASELLTRRDAERAARKSGVRVMKAENSQEPPEEEPSGDTGQSQEKDHSPDMT